MAKLIASEYCAEVTQRALRIHGGFGYSKDAEIERLMREAPFLLIAEHQAIAFELAEMATKVEAAHLMMVNAARAKDSGERNDVVTSRIT